MSFACLCLHEQVLMDKRVGLKRYELSGRKVLFYFDEVSLIHCWSRGVGIFRVCVNVYIFIGLDAVFPFL